MEAVFDVDELSGDAQPVAGLPDTPLEHSPDVELPADLPDIELHAIEHEGRGAGDDAYTLKVGEGVDEFLGDPFAKIILVLFHAHVGEGEDGDGRRFFADS